MKLQTKIFFRISIIVTLLIAIICICGSVFLVGNHRKDVKKLYCNQASFISEQCSKLLLWDDRVAVQKLADSMIAEHPEVEYFFIVVDNDIYVHTFEKGVPKVLIGLNAGLTQLQNSSGNVIYDVATAIKTSEAVLHIGLSREKIDAETVVVIVIISTASVIMITIGLMLAAKTAGITTYEFNEITNKLKTKTTELIHSNGKLQHEIANRKKAEKHMRKERDFAEGIIDTAQAIILVLDTKGRIVRFNPYMEKLTGYRMEEVKGKDWFSAFLPKRDHERIREMFLQAIDDIQTRGNVNPIITKDGREREIEWYDKTIKDAEGNTVGLLAVGQDVTERKENEQKLKMSIDEIERFNKLMIGREGRVIEIKKEVNSLLAELGKEPQYKSGLEDEDNEIISTGNSL